MVDTNPLAPVQEAKRRLRKRSSSSSDVTLGSDPSVVAALFDAPGAIASGVQSIGRGVSGLAGKVGLGGGTAADPAGITEPGNGGGFDAGTLASNIGQAVSSVGDGIGRVAGSAGNALSTATDGIGKVAEAAGDGLGHVVSNAGAALSGAGEVLSGAGEIAGQVLSTLGDAAGPAAEAAGEIVGGVLGALGDLDLN